MLNIRLSRVGKRNYAQYKVVVAEKSAPIKGKFVEQLGSYDPHTKELKVKEDRVKHWISQGAGCSETVHNLLVDNKIIEGKKISLTFKAKKNEETESETKEEKTDAKEEKADTNKEGGDNTGTETADGDKGSADQKDGDVKEDKPKEESKETDSETKKEDK